MRRPILVLVLVAVLFAALLAQTVAVPIAHAAPAAGITYYSKGSLAPNLTSSWNTNRTGGGSAPATFSSGDVFVIQNGHSMTTSATWSISGTGSKLWIENGGTLTANSAVTLASATTFQIDGGGTYVHNNNAGTPSSAIFAGTESFSATSTFEIKNWPNNTTALPIPTGDFGTLVINLPSAGIGGSWNQSGNITAIKGDFVIKSTGATGNEFRLTGNTALTLSIGGDLVISGGILNLTSGTGAPTVNIGGSFNQTSGTFTSSSSVSTVVFTGGSSSSVTFSTSGGTFTNTNINWQIASGKTVANDSPFTSGSWVASGRTMTVNGAFQVNDGSSTGSSGTWSYGSGATLIINRTSMYPVSGTSVYWPTSNGPTNVTVQNTGGINLGVSRTVNGALTVNSGATLATSATVTLGSSGTATINGSFQLDEGGYGTGGTWSYGAAATLIFNKTSDLYGPIDGNHAYWPATNGPTNVTVQGAGATLAVDRSVNGVLTVNSGATLATSKTLTVGNTGTATINGSFQINDGGWATGGTWTYGTGGTLIFNTSGAYGPIDDNHIYWPATNGPTNVTVQNTGGINLGVARTVTGVFQTSAGVTNGNNLTLNGTAQINAGGSFAAAPTYGASSTLVYNTGGTFGRGAEWSTTTPANVKMTGNTILNYPNGSTDARSMTGSLTIDAGSALYMDYGGTNPTGPLTVGGGVTLRGSLSLSNAYGGDIKVGGNWMAYAGSNFYPHGRAVFLNGGSVQTIGGDTATTFDYLNINNASGVSLAANATVNNDLTMVTGLLMAGANTLTFGNSATATGPFSASTEIVADGGGQVCKQFGGPGSFTYPVGDGPSSTNGSEYSPATLDFSGGTYTDAKACVKVTNTALNADPNYPTYLNRYWTITQSGMNGFSATATFTYNDNDLVVGANQSEAVLALWQFDAPSTWTYLALTNAGANTLSASGITGFSDFTGRSASPLAVNLANFTATLVDGRPVLGWETVSEQANAGFDLYRGESEQGPWVKLTNNLIPAAAPGSAEGHAYTWTDTTAVQGTYWYRLEDVDLSGSRTSHGPVRIDLAAPNAVSVRAFRARFDLGALLKALIGLR